MDGMSVQLFQGDCLEIMPTLPAASVDLVLCDLPYGITHCKWDSVIPLPALWSAYRRVTRAGRAVVLTAAQPFTTVLAHSNLEDFKYEWVWDKHIPRGFQVAKYRPMMRHENVLVFGAGKLDYFPIMVKRDKPATVKNYSKKTSVSSNDIGKYNNSAKVFTYTHKSPDSIIEGCWEPNAGKLHPTQKPVALMEYLIKTYTNPGDTVLDNCMGSGTTGVACVNTGRSFIGIEKDEAYFALAKQRIEDRQRLLAEVFS